MDAASTLRNSLKIINSPRGRRFTRRQPSPQRHASPPKRQMLADNMTRAALIVRGFCRRFLLEWGHIRPLRRAFQSWNRACREYSHIIAQERAELQSEMATVRKILQEKIHALAEQKRVLDKHYMRRGAEQKLSHLQVLCASILRSKVRRLHIHGWALWKSYLHSSLKHRHEIHLESTQCKLQRLRLHLMSATLNRFLHAALTAGFNRWILMCGHLKQKAGEEQRKLMCVRYTINNCR
jgi:hypothetical protein